MTNTRELHQIIKKQEIELEACKFLLKFTHFAEKKNQLPDGAVLGCCEGEPIGKKIYE